MSRDVNRNAFFPLGIKLEKTHSINGFSRALFRNLLSANLKMFFPLQNLPFQKLFISAR